MPQVVMAPSAQRDLWSIFDCISRDKPIAAANWIETVEQKCKLIATAPELGEGRTEYGLEIRSSFAGRYVIFYRSIDDGIEVVRIIPGDRDIRSL